ncbi:hypothetical protein JCM9279_000776 [Rhodotorula babjevae]
MAWTNAPTTRPRDLDSAEKHSLRKDDGTAHDVSLVPAERMNSADKLEHGGVDGDGDEVDGVFGKQGGEGTVNYRTVGWKTATVFIVKSQIGIGVLGLPGAFLTLGLVPGLLVFAWIAAATMWCDIYVGTFKLKHPQVYSISDCGTLMFGKWCGELFGVAYWLFCTFVAGSALLTISTAFNAVSLHAMCTAGWVAISAAIVFVPASLRTFGKLTWLGWGAVVSILAAIFTALIAIAVADRPALAPPAPEPFDLGVRAFADPSFTDAMNAVSAIFFAFTGTSSFLPIASEMRNPRDYPKAVLVGQSFVTLVYLVVAVTVYCTAGNYVASPALGTAGPLIKRIAYGLALPGVIFSAIMYTHLPAKWVFVRVLRGSHHLNHPTRTSTIVWLSCTAGCLGFSYIIASAIPVFGGLVGLIGALPAPIITLHAEALMWLYDNKQFFSSLEYRTRKRWCGVVLNIGLLILATFLTVAGTYGSMWGSLLFFSATVYIIDSEAGKPFSCADNSGSV